VPNDREELRASAVRQLDTAWAEAIDCGEELGRIFHRLLETQQQCHEYGLHTTVVFEDKLTQEAWNEFRRMRGDMVPRHDDEAPPIMVHEDIILERTVAHGNSE